MFRALVMRQIGRAGFPPLVWVVLAGALLTRTAFFMVWPFLAVILQREYHLSPSRIGSMLGSAFLAGACAAFYSGNLSDRFGRRRIMTAGCVVAVCAYVILATARSVAAYTAGAFLVGLARAFLESPGTALIADLVPDERTRHRAFHARYFLFNLAGALGPWIGVSFGLVARQSTFWITASMYAAFGCALARAFQIAPEKIGAGAHRHASLAVALGVLRQDRRFLILLVANFLMFLAYAQQESTLVQYVSLSGGAIAVNLVTALVMTNGLTIIVFQFPLLRLLRRQDLYVRTYVGLVLFGAAFVTYSLLPVAGLRPWIAATWVLSVGEAILFPTLQVQVDRLAQKGLRGSYFGAAALASLGFGLGPIVGGVLLEHIGGRATFLLTAASVVLCGFCYWLSSRTAYAPARSGLAGIATDTPME